MKIFILILIFTCVVLPFQNCAGGNGIQGSHSSVTSKDMISSPAWSGLLAPSRAIDWSHAGLPPSFPDGETPVNPWTPPTRTQCGGTIAGGTSGSPTSGAIVNSALNGCTAGTYLLLGSGYFAPGINAPPNNVTLRGSGAHSTILEGGVNFGGAGTNGGYASLTVSPVAGATSFTVSGSQPPTGFAWIQQCDTGYSATDGSFVWFISGSSGVACTGSHADNGGLYICGLDSACDTNGGTPTNASAQTQDIYITSVTGSGPYTVNFTPAIYMPNWSTNNTVTLAWQTNGIATGIGLEDFTELVGSEISGAYASWMKGVRIIDNTNTSAAPLLVQRAKNVLLANNYIYASGSVPSQDALREAFEPSNYEGQYGVLANSDNLYLNNIMQMGFIDAKGSNVGEVYAYNYLRDANTAFVIAEQQHYPGTSFILREGNQMANSWDDDTWAPKYLDTWFRNYYTCTDANYTSGLDSVIQVGNFNRFENVIGNALGSSSCTGGYTGNSGSIYYFPGSDALTTSSLMRWGNFDSATATTRWVSSEVPTSLSGNAAPFANPVPASQNLPPSFFMSNAAGSPPAWFNVCTSWSSFPTTCASTHSVAYPSVGPDVATGSHLDGHANDIPAALAFENLPIDTSYQISYAATGSSWSNGIETINVSLPGGVHVMGGFQLTSANSACNPSGGELFMTGSTSSTISYALTSNPGVTCTGTVEWPDIREFDERVYEKDSSGSASPTPVPTPKPTPLPSGTPTPTPTPTPVPAPNPPTNLREVSVAFYYSKFLEGIV
jgi:hypothetical protein